MNNKIRYKTEDYEKLKHFYDNKIQQIHIVGEYAKKMIQDYKEALQFVEDYFQLNYSSFIKKYFPGSRENEIKRNITPAKFRQLFGELSPSQLNIINDKSSKNIVVAAGPGSGKTRVLVHKLASLLLMEDVKHEQLLMVTFSRAAATEFKKRLFDLIGNAAAFIEIKTFHAYCFDLLGRVGSLEKSQSIISNTVEKIKSKDIETNRITKAVLVIDEAQDMDRHEFELIKTLMEHNEDMRVIAVGDDDQNIYEFRGASSEHLERFISEQQARKVELIQNYRSKANLVDFTNQFVNRISKRLKETPIIAQTKENGHVKIITHKSSNLIVPVVKHVSTSELKGSTCILTTTNDEALQIEGLLKNNNISAKLIQSNDNFHLYDLKEIRYFLDQLDFSIDKYIISDQNWRTAKLQLKNEFKVSPNFEICVNLIKDFELSNPKKKYQSDVEIFIRESKIEDFINSKVETILISTIHKAKGKEFDNVFMVLSNFNPNEDKRKRQLYVGMTRAKNNLTIHLNGNYFDDINCENLKREYDEFLYNPAELLTIHLTHKDIWLDYFMYQQGAISKLNSGDELKVDSHGCYNSEETCIIKFSKSFQNTINLYHQKGYQLSEAKVNYILYWKKEQQPDEILIILPELKFTKNVIHDNLKTITSSQLEQS